jgi:two-component system chemotaxis response regulator CheY
MASVVIVVDDSKSARLQVRNTLGDGGFEVIEAANGREGLAKLAEHPTTCLMICDINMPVMSGLEMLEQMRSSGDRTPVLMLTTEAGPELQRRARAAGAAGWIVKPFNPAMLVQTVRALVRGAGGAEGGGKAPPGAKGR